MLPSIFHSLRFQIASVVLLLASLMLGAAWHTTTVIREQRTLDTLLLASGKLQLALQTLEKQSLNYLENAPRDYPTYYRDVKLYYEDLKAHIDTFDMFTDAFMHRAFMPEATGLSEALYPKLDHATMDVVQRVEQTWADYRSRLMEQLGDDTAEPRLEWAAQFVAVESRPLETVTDALAAEVRRQADARTERIKRVNTVLIGCYVAISVLVVIWFFRRVIRRLASTANAFRRVAAGDFGHQIPVRGRDEISSLTSSFNQLSQRVHGLVELTTHIQRGSDLDQTLRFIAQDFPRLMPLDWVGMLFDCPTGRVRLERAYRHAAPVTSSRQAFAREDALLAAALSRRAPLHAALPVNAASEHSEFADWLAAQGLRDVILLPVREQTPNDGVLVFASQQPAGYTSDHLELMQNIGLLVSLSFARTVQLAESARLAAIGEFTTGIVHELRTPLATVGLALEYLRGAELGQAAARRTELAAAETDRMERLLSDVLQYARPLTLSLAPLNLTRLVTDTLAAHSELISTDQRLVLPVNAAELWVSGDTDRMTQVILNLTKNAAEAAGPEGRIEWRADARAAVANLSIVNTGPAIPADRLERLFEPFFTTKAGGTGLGLGIVKRIVQAHGGTIAVTSDAVTGTCFSISLPPLENSIDEPG